MDYPDQILSLQQNIVKVPGDQKKGVLVRKPFQFGND